MLAAALLVGNAASVAPPKVTAAPAPAPIGQAGVTMVGSATAPRNVPTGLTVMCPTGTVAVSGGVDPQFPDDMIVTSSGPSFGPNNGDRLYFRGDGSAPVPTGWFGAVSNTDPDVDRKFTVGVVCRSLSDVTTVVESAQVPAGGYWGTISICPSGQVAIGGGVDLENIWNMDVTSSGPLFASDSVGGISLWSRPTGVGPAPNGWRAFAYNRLTTEMTIKVATICRPAGYLISMVSKAASVLPGSYDGARATCPTGTRAIGGGVDTQNVWKTSVTSSAPALPSSTYNRFGRIVLAPNGENPPPVGWMGTYLNRDTVTKTVKIGVLCDAPAVYLPLVVKP